MISLNRKLILVVVAIMLILIVAIMRLSVLEKTELGTSLPLGCDKSYDEGLLKDHNFKVVINESYILNEIVRRDEFINYFSDKYPYLKEVFSSLGSIEIDEVIKVMEGQGYVVGTGGEAEFIGRFIAEELELATYSLIIKNEKENFLGEIPVLLEGESTAGIYVGKRLLYADGTSEDVSGFVELYDNYESRLGVPQAKVVDELNGGRSLDFYFDLGLAFIPSTAYSTDTILLFEPTQEADSDFMRHVDRDFYRPSLRATCSDY